jgi:predicted nucleic acid-binding protein
VIVLDTSGVLAALDAGQANHRAAADVLRGTPGPRILSPFVLAELDYLVTTRVSRAMARAFLAEVAAGAYHVEPFSNDDVATALAIQERYAGLELSLADASLVVLADRHGTHDIFTLDQRQFRALTAIDGQPFRLLPADNQRGSIHDAQETYAGAADGDPVRSPA